MIFWRAPGTINDVYIVYSNLFLCMEELWDARIYGGPITAQWDSWTEVNL